MKFSNPFSCKRIRKNTKLSENFYFGEFFISKAHPKLAKSMKATKQDFERLRFLCDSILQPARDGLGFSLHVISGKRDFKLNASVGGAINSDHTKSIAADVESMNYKDVFLYIKESKLPFRQLIIYPDNKFVHVSCNIPGEKYKQDIFVKYSSDKTYYPYSKEFHSRL